MIINNVWFPTKSICKADNEGNKNRSNVRKKVTKCKYPFIIYIVLHKTYVSIFAIRLSPD